MDANDWLEGIFFIADKLSRPTLTNLCASFEQYHSRSGLARAVSRWERAGWLKCERTARDVVYRLTEAGRRRVEPFPDVRVWWDTPWDGQWRAFLFDLPGNDSRTRMMLWRWLRNQRFGYLQDSVWVRPHPVTEILQSLAWFQDNPEMYIVLEARRLAGGADSAIVNGAWDFTVLQDRYRQHLDAVADAQRSLAKASAPPALAALIRRERQFYADALRHDPLLPRSLWPAGYLGPASWRARTALQTSVRQHFAAQLAAV